MQAAGQRARRHAQTMIGQTLQQALARVPVEEFVEHDGGPHRHPVLAPLDQSWRGGALTMPGTQPQSHTGR